MFSRLIRLGLPVVFLAASAVATPVSQAAPANLFADVDQFGTLLHGGGVSGVSRLGSGRYEVTFGKNVSNCAYVATTANAYSQALGIFTAGGHFGSNGVYVETKNQGGGLTDGPFNLVVDCGTSGMQYAVVGYDANLARATNGATLANLGSGRYNVTFPSSVKNCAYLATVGDPGNALVYSPSGVYTGSGPNTNTVYVETKNPGGGLQSGIPFHLAVICPNAPNTRTLVVGLDGVPDRGSALTSSFLASTGNYQIATSSNVGACATVATRGSIDQNVPYSPATVEITPGLAPNTVGIQERNLLFFGGNFLNESFHAAIVC
jgi:hypothetical protein